MFSCTEVTRLLLLPWLLLCPVEFVPVYVEIRSVPYLLCALSSVLSHLFYLVRLKPCEFVIVGIVLPLITTLMMI